MGDSETMATDARETPTALIPLARLDELKEAAGRLRASLEALDFYVANIVTANMDSVTDDADRRTTCRHVLVDNLGWIGTHGAHSLLNAGVLKVVAESMFGEIRG